MTHEDRENVWGIGLAIFSILMFIGAIIAVAIRTQ